MLEQIFVAAIVIAAAAVVFRHFLPRHGRPSQTTPDTDVSSCGGGCSGCGQAGNCQLVNHESSRDIGRQAGSVQVYKSNTP